MNNKQTEPEEVSEVEESSEPRVPPVTFEELARIDKIFREQHHSIRNDIAEVLAKYDIKGYGVTGVTFIPPNPSLCLPSVQYVPGVGFQLVVSCLD